MSGKQVNHPITRQALAGRAQRAAMRKAERDYLDSEQGFCVIIDLGALIEFINNGGKTSDISLTNGENNGD